MGKLFGAGNPEDRSLQDEQTRIMWENAVPFFRDSPTIQEIVTRVKAGESAKWQNASSGTDRVMAGHDEAVDLAQGAAQALESAWSGAGADAAREKIKVGSTAAARTADVYRQNRQHYDENVSAFDALKAKLPENLPAKEPELSAWDSVTPWDTDQEDKANQYKAQIQETRNQYSTHQSSTVDSSMAVEGNFGRLQEFDGKLGDISQGADADGPTGSGVIDIPDPNSDGGGDGGGPVTTGDPVGGGPIGGGPVRGGYQSPDNPGDAPTPSYTSPNDHTGTSGYTPPSTAVPPAANYPGPSYPGSGGFGPAGPGPAAPGTGGGPIGTTGFGPTGGGTSGHGGSAGGAGGRFSTPGIGGGAGGSSGGAAGGGTGAGGGNRAGAPGAGRMTGAAPGGFGPTGSGGAGAGAAGATGAGSGARGGMGAMGGAGRGGGQGSEDEEHQRKYVADTDAHFALTEEGEVLRDPKTGFVATPPTIGE